MSLVIENIETCYADELEKVREISAELVSLEEALMEGCEPLEIEGHPVDADCMLDELISRAEIIKSPCRRGNTNLNLEDASQGEKIWFLGDFIDTLYEEFDE